MDLKLEDDDDMILIVIGEEDKDNDDTEGSSTKQKSEGPVDNMPFPVTIKVEPLEEDEVVSLNVENLIRTAAEHGQLIEIKDEKPDDYEVPVTRAKSKYMKAKTAKNAKNKKVTKNKTAVAKKSTSTSEKSYGTRRPPVSYVEELRQSYPQFRKDRKALLDYLENMMRMTVPPDPPMDYYVIDVDGQNICSFCEYKTHTVAAAARHYQNSHGTRYLTCYSCGADFWSKVNLYKHEKRCTAPDAKIVLQARGQYLGRKGRGRPYLSNNKFKPRMNPLDPATGEEKLPAGKRKFQCSFCPAQFVHIESWESHENIHKGMRPFKCHLCPSAYPSKVGLRKHRMTHGDQVFTCDHCKKSFKLKVTLISHMNTHLPQSKYGCDLCSKRYSQKTALMVHINRDHLNLPPPCACPQCPKRYPRMSHLKDHMLKEHGLKLMTRKMFYKNLPRMNLQELKAAQVVFNQPQPTYSSAPYVDDGDSPDVAERYLEVPDDDYEQQHTNPHTQVRVITEKTPVFHIRLSSS